MTHAQDTSEGPNPSGLCMCGCGQPTPIASHSRASLGYVAGKPIRYVHGHNTRKSPVEYIVDNETGCWVWQRARTTDGYGHILRDGKARPAHRCFYERAHGPVPDGMHLDHLCRNRACVNPAHLEPVTHAENVRRGVSARLNADKVREIRDLWGRGEATKGDLAQRFGVTPDCIDKVVRRINWRDVA